MNAVTKEIEDETAHVLMPLPKARPCSFKWPEGCNLPSTCHLEGVRCKNVTHRDVKFCDSRLSLIARAESWSGHCDHQMKCNTMAQYVLAMNDHFRVHPKNFPLMVVLETVCNMDASADPEFVCKD